MESWLAVFDQYAPLIVAGCALVLTIANMWMLRRHQERSTRPLLVIQPDKHAGGDVFSYKLAIRNRGLGPAILKRLTFTYADDEVDLETLARGHIGRALPATVTVFPLEKGDALVPGDERLLFSISARLDLRDPSREELSKRLKKMGIEIRYESLYGWRTKARLAPERKAAGGPEGA